MMKTDFKCTHFPFIYPFKTSHGLKKQQDAFLVKLDHNGWVGYGEVSAIDYYGVSLDFLTEQFLMVKHAIENHNFENPYHFHQFLESILPENEFLICALDIAAWDLYGKIQQKPIYDIWNLSADTHIKTDYTIGIDSIEIMLAKLKANPYPIYKVKLGTPHDLEIIKCLRDNTDSKIRIDANAGWTLAEALHLIPELQKLNVELIEQPLAKNAWADMKILKNESPLPLIADESCVIESDVERCLEGYHGINIKLSKCGGITPALRMIKNARKLELQVMMGCMNENVIGSAAIAQFINLLDYVDADGPLLQSELNAKGLSYTEGRMQLSQENGLGIQLIEAF